jgi:lipopolysaccharide/colanic/teichoic acid biosynthesis glycosyltransferase
MLGIGLAVRLTSPGPALFESVRIGRGGRPFRLYKFRSMTAEAPRLGPAITTANDPRVTPFGARLRRLKLDELPQLLNVFKGDMSLVGPRPEAPAFVRHYTRQQLAILDFKPGITSPASLAYSDEEVLLAEDHWQDRYIDEVMPSKLSIDLDYFAHRTLISDLGIILRTVLKVLRGNEPPRS